jgi:phosphatidylserine synthase
MIIGVYTIPTLITYIGLLGSFSACAFAINGKLDIAVVLFMLSRNSGSF